jgi:hypothetical protein
MNAKKLRKFTCNPFKTAYWIEFLLVQNQVVSAARGHNFHCTIGPVNEDFIERLQKDFIKLKFQCYRKPNNCIKVSWEPHVNMNNN